MVGGFNDEINFPFKFLLSCTQFSKIRKNSANGSSASIKPSKTQLSKITLLGEFVPLKLLLNPRKVMFDCIKKVQNLAEKCVTR